MWLCSSQLVFRFWFVSHNLCSPQFAWINMLYIFYLSTWAYFMFFFTTRNKNILENILMFSLGPREANILAKLQTWDTSQTLYPIPNTVSLQKSIHWSETVGLRYPPRCVTKNLTKPNRQYLALARVSRVIVCLCLKYKGLWLDKRLGSGRGSGKIII